MESIKPSFRNPLKLIINTTIALFIVLLLLYIGLRVWITYDYDINRSEMLKLIAEDVRALSLSAFMFIRPFLQLVIILVILEWLLNKFGLSLSNNLTKLEWNIQTIIAIIVIIAFSLAALSGIEGASMLKDLALVVVGFYFGTQKKTVEVVSDNGKISTTDEHLNERKP